MHVDPTERIVRTLAGEELDRVQTFCVTLDDWPMQQVLGTPLIQPKTIFMNPLARFIFDRWGKKMKKILVDPFLTGLLMQRLEAAVRLGFDAAWTGYDETFMTWDSKTLARCTGSFYDWIEDGHGNMYYMYRGPAITSPEAFDAWPYFPDADGLAQRTYEFFKKAFSKFGDRVCIIGGSGNGLHETMLWSLGFEKVALFTRKEPAFIRRFVALLAEYSMKCCMAIMDAGITVLIQGDDFGFKTGPMLNPKLVDDLFGESYTRLIKAVHDRGGKIILHSCGDNTKLFDLFIKWGFDGGHAYENTSNVDIAYEKRVHGDRFTIVGGIGVDYLLTERSRPEEVVEGTKRLMKTCAPGGRFLIGPVHDHPDIDISKVRIMLETVWEHGQYPISL